MEYLTREVEKRVPIYLVSDKLIDLKLHLEKIDFDKIIVVTDSNVHKLWGKVLNESIKGFNSTFFTFKAGELSKNFSTYQKLYNKILDYGITKKTLIIAFGGGVTGNIVGLIAATLYRGVRFVHIPTTIIAQADSTIGGKQAINTKHGKNILGVFYEPEFIFADFQFLKTLPEREIACGISECIKHALCQDNVLFERIYAREENFAFIEDIITKTIHLKLNIIEKDRKEINEGKILLYGHTIGHAIETLSKGKLNHGEAISIGMCCAAQVSNQLSFLSEENLQIHYEIFKKWNLPTNMPKYIKIDQVIKQLNYDKKMKDSKIELILLESIGKILKIDNKVGMSISEDQLKFFLKKCY